MIVVVCLCCSVVAFIASWQNKQLLDLAGKTDIFCLHNLLLNMMLVILQFFLH